MNERIYIQHFWINQQIVAVCTKQILISFKQKKSNFFIFINFAKCVTPSKFLLTLVFDVSIFRPNFCSKKISIEPIFNYLRLHSFSIVIRRDRR